MPTIRSYLHLVGATALLLAFAPLLQAETPDAEFSQVAEEFIKGYLTARPLLGTRLGMHENDGKITDFSRLALDAELARLRRFDDRLKKIDGGKLSPRASVDLRILQAAVHNELFRFQDAQVYERNPITYANAADLNIYITRNFSPLEDRARSVIAIESQVPNAMIAAKTNLAPVLAKPQVELAMKIARGSADFMRKNLLAAFADIKDEKIRGDLVESTRKAAASLTDYANWLERERMPKATDDFALGEEKFNRWLADVEFMNLPAARVLDIGLAQLKKEQDAFAEAAKAIDSNRPAPDVYKDIQKEHPTAENLLPAVTKNLEAIRKFVVDHKLVSIPSNVRAQIKETPQYRRATSFASMDTPGPFEKRSPDAYYYVTPPEADWPDDQKDQWLTSFNSYTADIVSVHEAYPGHYVQFLRLNASTANKVEKIFGSYGFIEGWAHYCEQMVLEQGFGAVPKEKATDEDNKRAAKYRMAQSAEAMLRLCRLCAAIKIHTQKQSVDDATKFFIENCYYEEKPARAEAMRGTFDYGYLNYTLGKLEILKLRDDFKAQEGDKFSLQKFHDQMLDHGMPQIRLLRELMLKDKAKWDQVL